MKRFFKDVKGVASIEATIALVSFTLALITIYNFVNYCRVQTMVSNALDATAKELSQYSYFYHLTGLQELNNKMNSTNYSAKNTVNNVYNTVEDLYGAIGNMMDKYGEKYDSIGDVILIDQDDIDEVFDDIGVDSTTGDIKADGTSIMGNFEKVEDAIGDVVTNPLKYLKALGLIAGTEGMNVIKSHLIAAPFAKSMMTKHFGESSEAANALLLDYGVVDGLNGMNFRLSTIFNPDSPQDINLVCCYKMKVASFMGIQFGDVVISEQSRTHAWLGGDRYDLVVPNKDNSNNKDKDKDNSSSGTSSSSNNSSTSSNNSSSSSNNSSTSSSNSSSKPSSGGETDTDTDEIINPWTTLSDEACEEYIQQKETEKYLNDNGYSVNSPYASAYSEETGFVYFTAINFTQDTYSDSGERYIMEVEQICNVINELKNQTVTVVDANGNQKSVSGASNDLILVIFAPEGSTPEYVENYKAYLEDRYPDIEVIVYEDYGKAN